MSGQAGHLGTRKGSSFWFADVAPSWAQEVISTEAATEPLPGEDSCSVQGSPCLWRHTPDYPEPQTSPCAVPRLHTFGLVLVFGPGGTQARELGGGVLSLEFALVTHPLAFPLTSSSRDPVAGASPACHGHPPAAVTHSPASP